VPAGNLNPRLGIHIPHPVGYNALVSASVKTAYLQAFGAAALFGLSAPLLSALHVGGPRVTAAVLYGTFGLVFFVLFRPWREGVAPGERTWLAASLLFGGNVAPLLLMLGLASVSGAEATLWLGAEPILTVVWGLVLFREPVGRTLWASVALFAAAGALLVGVGELTPGIFWLLGAAAAWSFDNQASARVVSLRAESLAAWKGLAGFAGNATLALVMGDTLGGRALDFAGVAAIGLVAYGFSLWLILRAMRTLGGGRAATAFSVTPFAGALAGTLLGQGNVPVWALGTGAVLVSAAGYLLLHERHDHEHAHEPLAHTHEHVHDEHHAHTHAPGDSTGEPHTHPHVHVPLVHAHPHLADVHHRHH
jgi:drug/metabolite transporter (DMT)-like permease